MLRDSYDSQLVVNTKHIPKVSQQTADHECGTQEDVMPVMTTDRLFFAAEDDEHENDFNSELQNFKDIENEGPIIELNQRRSCMELEGGIDKETFQSIAEEVPEKLTNVRTFQDSKSKANCCSILTFWFANTLVDSISVNKGKMDEKMIEEMNRDPKRDEDLLKYFKSKLNSNIEAWQKKNPGKQAHIEWYEFTKSTIWSTIGCQFFLVGFISLIAELLSLVSIFMIKFLADYLTKEENDTQEPVILVAIFSCSLIMGSLLRNFQIYYGYSMALELRKILIAAMYDKIGKLSMRSLTETNHGKLITQVSQDIFSIERSLAMAPFGLASPFINIACYAMIWYIAGWPYAIVIFGLWILSVVCQCFTSFIQSKLKASEAKRNNNRLMFIYDMIRGIRTIKSQAYESKYSKKVQQKRADQVQYTFWLNMIGSMGFSFFQNWGFIAILCICIPKWYNNEMLELGEMFTLLALNYYLFFSVNSLTYYSINTISQLYAVTYRLSKILKLQEHTVKRQNLILLPDLNDDKSITKPSICIKNAEYAWGYRVSELEEKKNSITKIRLDVENLKTSVLHNINLTMMPNELVTVVGKIGSGKTSLLHSIMDETILKKGEHEVNGRIAYVEKEPFLFEGTVQDNICFGLEYAECRFRKAVSAAQLNLKEERDDFRKGWQTQIEDKGKHLSSSQKVRISLARAIYSDADIYLLDDPLSAVEPYSASRIFSEVIQEFLAQKCVILVTNQPQYLTQAKRIFFIRDGGQVSTGTYDEILQQGLNFDDVFQQFRKVTCRMMEAQLDQEAIKQEQLMQMARDQATKPTGKNYVDQVNRSTIDINSEQSQDMSEEEAELRRKIRQRERNIKMLRKQVLALAQEELSNAQSNSIELFSDSTGQTLTTATTVNGGFNKLTKRDLVFDQDYHNIVNEVKWSDYRKFLSFAYGSYGIFAMAVISILTAIAQLLPSLWLTKWLVKEQDDQQDTINPIIFSSLIASFLLFTLIRSIALFKIILGSSTNLHQSMTEKVLRAKLQFFDSNRVGCIVSRFSQDLVIIDLVVPIVSMIVIQGFFRTGSVVLMIAIINPWMIVVICFCTFLMYLTMKKGSKAMIETQRQDATLRSPIQHSLQKMVQGMIQLRATDKTNLFRQEFLNNLKMGTNATYCYVITNRWIAFRLDILCCIFISFVCASLIAMKGTIESSWLVMSLQVATDIIFLFSISFRMYSEIENHMISSMRMIAYTNLEEEDDLEKPEDAQLERNLWPSQGKIDFEECTMSYRDELAPSIKNLTFKAQAGMRIGIIGPTGSGKSSILQTLYRFIELSDGRTSIDGVDIKTVGLHLLRKSISFIPRSPFLIRGTIRENIDPQGMSTDSQITSILREMSMYDKVFSLPKNLDTQISESNNLFSIGQKQLLCLVGAIIKKSRVVIFDEASVNLDISTESLIQQTLRERLNHCTVFVVAHRIASIIDADRVMVMKDGQLQEYSHPYKLLVEQEGDKTVTNIRGQFAKMAISLGVENAHDLFEIAQSTYQQYKNKFYEPLKNSLSVTDNRTGKTYELQIQNNTINATQLLQIKTVSGNVTRSFDPSYMNTVNCISKICYVDGEKGILEYRGVPIDQLARRSRFVETAFLLVYGQLPSKEQLLCFEQRIRSNYIISDKLKNFIQAYQKENMVNSQPMGIMQTLISSLSSCHLDAIDSFCKDGSCYDTQEKRDIHIHRVLGLAPAIAAACLRIFQKKEIVEPNLNMGFVPNFLRMAFGLESQVAKNMRIIKAIEALFILHAEHELSCATAALRHMTSTQADVYTSLSGSVTALYGPRNGGASEAVVKMLEKIGKVQNVSHFIMQVKKKEQVLCGFGHRIYKNYDPRATFVKQIAEQVFQETGREELIDIAMELERVALTDEYFINRKLYPNIDFYSGIIYKAIGFPTEFFTVLVALPRFAGWMSHWNEFINDPDNKIVRPRQIYTGERARNYVHIHDRLPEELSAYMTKGFQASKCQINLPTIISCDDGSSEISMTQTDMSMDFDRRQFMQKQQSRLTNEQNQTNKEAKKSKFISNQLQDEESSSETHSQESHRGFSYDKTELKGSLVNPRVSKLLPGSIIQIADQTSSDYPTVQGQDVQSEVRSSFATQTVMNNSRSQRNFQFRSIPGRLTPDQSVVHHTDFGLHDDSIRSIPDECHDDIKSKM